MKLLKDCFYLWGQTPMSHHAGNNYKLPGINRMDTAEGCDFFGIDRTFRVAMATGPVPPFDMESQKLKHLKEVVWAAIGSGSVLRNNEGLGDLPEVLRQAEIFPNISGAILDDFFNSVEGFKLNGKIARHPVENVEKMRDLLHGFPLRKLDLWLVFYPYQLDFAISDYLGLFDKVTLWTWNGCDLADWRRNFEKTRKMLPDTPLYAGCYMWDYGDRKPLPLSAMKRQLADYRQALLQGEIKGVILCSNCIADIGLDTVEYTRTWLQTHGEEEVIP